MTVESLTENDVRMDMGALWSAIRRRWLRVLLVTIVVLAGTYALLLFVPKSYEATASLLVENRDSVYTRPANDTSGSGAFSADELSSIISSPMQLAQSRDTLLDVVRSQKLASVPEFNGTASSPFNFITRFFKKPGTTSAEEVALQNLSGHITVIRERDSAVISILVRAGDPKLAADLANAIANADIARRVGLSLSDTVDATRGLQQQIAQMRQQVADAEGKVANFKVENDLFTGTNNTSLLDQQMSDLSGQITAAQGRMNIAQSRATLIRGLLKAGQPIDGVEDVRNSATIQQLMTQRAQLTSQRAQLLATLLPTHPSVQAVTSQIVEVDKQITIEGRRVADALLSEAKIEGALQASLEANLASLKLKSASATKQGVTLDALERDAKASRDLLESYLSRYGDAASRTGANTVLPDVRVVTLAAPPSAAASPKTPLILGLVGLATLALQIGGVLFGELLSGRALVERPHRPLADVEPDESEQGEADAPPTQSPLAAEPVAAELPHPAPVDAPEPQPASEGTSWFNRARAVASSLTTSTPPVIDTGLVVPASSPPVPVAAAPLELAAAVSIPADPVAPPAPVKLAPQLPDVDDDSDALAEAANAERLANLSADLILGRTRVVMLAGLGDHHESEALAERLIADVLRRGLSVALVDAGSGRLSIEPGITDLGAEEVSFGDVVHKTGEEGLAEVPWGHLPTLDRQSTRPLTLVEALSDIYEVVIVMTGPVGTASSLSMFTGVPWRVVLVSSGRADTDEVENARSVAAHLGFNAVEIIAAPAWQARVA